MLTLFLIAFKTKQDQEEQKESIRIKQVNEIKSKFFANISHEFRTPLTLINGPLEDLKQDEQYAYLPIADAEMIQRNSERLLQLVNQLLDLARIDEGKLKIQIKKGDVLQKIKALSQSFMSYAQRHHIHFSIRVKDHPEWVFFDEEKFEKIFVNILFNALKFTPEKGSVSVDAQVEQGMLQLKVQDSGPGISEEEISKLFDRFYQSAQHDERGTGIGLALVKELVDLHKGQIEVQSNINKGSIFIVRIPVDQSSYSVEDLALSLNIEQSENFIAPPNKIDLNKLNARFDSGEYTILIVDDNDDLKKYIGDTLSDGYNILFASDGSEGYQVALKNIPDLIITDLMMPVMDGLTFSTKVRDDQKLSHIPLILLTAKATNEDRIAGLKTGVDDYLTKPFHKGELIARVHNLIQQRAKLREKYSKAFIIDPSEVGQNSMDEQFIAKLKLVIAEELDNEQFGVEALAQKMHYSRSQLHRKLMAISGQSPSQIIKNCRLQKAQELLLTQSMTATEVAFVVGFSSVSYFSKCFKETFGKTPSEYVGQVL